MAAWNAINPSNLLGPAPRFQTKMPCPSALGWKGQTWTEREAVAAVSAPPPSSGEAAAAPFYTWLGNTCRATRHMLPQPHHSPWRMGDTWRKKDGKGQKTFFGNSPGGGIPAHAQTGRGSNRASYREESVCTLHVDEGANMHFTTLHRSSTS